MTVAILARRASVSSQAFSTMLEKPLYIGIVDEPDYGVRWKRGDFEPLITEEVFYRVQAVLAGRIQPMPPRQRNRPNFRFADLVAAQRAVGD